MSVDMYSDVTKDHDVLKASITVKRNKLKLARQLIRNARFDKIKEPALKRNNLCSPVMRDYDSMILETSNKINDCLLFRELRISLLKQNWDFLAKYLSLFFNELSKKNKSQLTTKKQKERLILFYKYFYILLLNHPNANQEMVNELLSKAETEEGNTSPFEFLDQVIIDEEYQ